MKHPSMSNLNEVILFLRKNNIPYGCFVAKNNNFEFKVVTITDFRSSDNLDINPVKILEYSSHYTYIWYQTVYKQIDEEEFLKKYNNAKFG